MSRRAKIISILIIIILVAVLLWLFLNRSQGEEQIILLDSEDIPITLQPSSPAVAVAIDTVVTTSISPREVEEKQNINNLIKIASAFAERFGSYSNQNSFQNIQDLQIFMTDSMKNWSKSYIIDSKSQQEDNSIYYGVTTKALSTEVVNYNEGGGIAEILVKTQRREAMGSTSNAEVYYQDILIKMKQKKGDIWKVDSAFWQ